MKRSAEESAQAISNDNQGLSDLIRNASRGDSEALSELRSNPAFAKKLKRIAAHVLERYGSRGVYRDAEDLQQEVSLRVLSNIEALRNIRSDTEFFDWTRSMTRTIYLDSLRKSVLEKRSVGEDELSQTEGTGREDQNYATASKELLDLLDPEQAKILELITQGCTSRQVADRLGISIATAYRLVSQVQRRILGEVDELTRRMKKSQIEIEQEQELTRHLINELRA